MFMEEADMNTINHVCAKIAQYVDMFRWFK